MTRDEILDVFDRVFGAGKYPRGLAIMAGEELVGAGRREAATMARAIDGPEPRYRGCCLNKTAVRSDSLSVVAGQMLAWHEDGWRVVVIIDQQKGQIIWRSRDLPGALMELYLLAGVKPK